jgi:putative FmdB family regulatory protein
MPIYEYRCEQGHTFEVMQRMTDDPIATCQACDRPAARVLHPVAVHFKGKGFYNTDYGTRKRQRETAAAAEGASSGDAASSRDAASSGDSSSTSSSSTSGDGAKSEKGSKESSSSTTTKSEGAAKAASK